LIYEKGGGGKARCVSGLRIWRRGGDRGTLFSCCLVQGSVTAPTQEGKREGGRKEKGTDSLSKRTTGGKRGGKRGRPLLATGGGKKESQLLFLRKKGFAKRIGMKGKKREKSVT